MIFSLSRLMKLARPKPRQMTRALRALHKAFEVPAAPRRPAPLVRKVRQPAGEPPQPQADTAVDEAPATGGTFTARQFTHEGTRRKYWLYVPSLPVPPAQPLPVVVMLHGCKQDALDFARGTGMNALAEAQKFIVLYPEQLAKANAMRCWNWFERAHQKRGAGEPEMIASLTRKVVAREKADASRVYVAGLSAGGAMAAVVANQYPDVFAAAGVHSGLPQGAAWDVVTAFRAMRKGGPDAVPVAAGVPEGTPAARAGRHTAGPVPTIVFHGTADKTVHPSNGEQVVQAALAAFSASGQALQPQSGKATAGRRAAKRAIYTDESGQPRVEAWVVDASPHAWSGGDAAGSYTDPQGPDASAAMLDFMLQQKLPGREAR